MGKPSPTLIALAVAATFVGCQQPPSEAQHDGTVPQQVAQQTAQPSGYKALFDQWEAFHKTQLTNTAREMEKRYRELKANPPLDERTNKPINVQPRDGVYGRFSPSGGPFLNGRPLTPAISTFGPHVGGMGRGVIGQITPEAARLRLLFEQKKLLGYWMFFRYEPGLSREPLERFEDAVGTSEFDLAQFKRVEKIGIEAAKNPGFVAQGELDGWTFEVRPLKLLEKTCLTCHNTKQVGDVVGLMLYMAKPAP